METYFQLLIPLMLTGFAIGFVAIHRVWKKKAVALVALAYLYVVSGFLFDIIHESLHELWRPLIVNTIYAVAVVALASGIQHHYSGTIRTRLLSTALAIHISVVLFFCFIGNPWMTTFSANFGIALLFAIGIFGIQNHMETKLDKTLLLICIACIVQNLARPLILANANAGPLTAEIFDQQQFITALQLSIAVCAIAMAMVLMMIFARSAFEDIKRSSLTDGLTGTNNRMALQEAISKMDAKDNATRLCVILADIDDFKSINNTHGHAIGDQLIVEVARIFEHHASVENFPARVGGDDFAMLTMDLSLHDATALAVTMRKEISELRLKEDGRIIRITASFGVSERRGQEDLQRVLGRADQAVFASKDNGGNRVTSELTVQEDDWDARVVTKDRRRHRPRLATLETV